MKQRAMRRFVRALAILALFAAIAAASPACSKKSGETGGGTGETILSVEAVVHGPGETERRAKLGPGEPMKLAEGEWTTIATTRYAPRAGGGELRIENGQIKGENVDVTDILKGK